jgi:cytochrome c oxidase subunit 2
MQSTVWYISLVGIALLAGVFYFVISNSKSREEYSAFQERWYSFRNKWFIFLAILGISVTAATLIPFPLPSQAENYGSEGDQVVDVSGHQWYWTISSDTVVAGKPVVFRVTGADVNHGFGIYNEDLQLVAQVQAMPGYTNKLIYTFDQPGKYRILCLEYCGLAHHAMMGELNVKAAS